LEALAKRHPGVKLRIVDVGSWDSDAARQHQIQRLPTVWLFEGGELSSKDQAAVFAKLNSLR
jgi:hypothetical protein